MAKKKKSNSKVSLNGLILTIFGAAMLLLALLPAVKVTSTLIGNESVSNTSFWSYVFNIFENGFGEGSVLALQITSILYLVLGIISLVFGVLGLLGILKTTKVSVLFYLLTFVVLLVYMIVFLSTDIGTLNASLSIGGFNIASAKSSTLVYIPLGVSALFTGYGIYKMLKN